MSNSSFASVAFFVEPDDGFYPKPEPDDDLVKHYKCTAVFKTLAAYAAMESKISVSVEKRPLGQTSYNVHVEAGYGPATLIVPNYGGVQTSYTAVLKAITNAEGYARRKKDNFRADLDFVVVPA